MTNLLRNLTVMLLMATLATGCASISGKPPKPAKPTKPTLSVQVTPDGGFCVDRTNAEKLGLYILELERSF